MQRSRHRVALPGEQAAEPRRLAQVLLSPSGSIRVLSVEQHRPPPGSTARSRLCPQTRPFLCFVRLSASEADAATATAFVYCSPRATLSWLPLHPDSSEEHPSERKGEERRDSSSWLPAGTAPRAPGVHPAGRALQGSAGWPQAGGWWPGRAVCPPGTEPQHKRWSCH